MDITDIHRRLHKVKGMSQFARSSGVSRATLYRILNGWANPNLRTLERIELELDRLARVEKR